jgi:amylosucrase
MVNPDLDEKARLSLERLLPRLRPILEEADDPDVFIRRLHQYFPRLFGLLYGLYGDRYDFFYHLEEILRTAAQSYAERSAELRALDQRREADHLWFQREQMVGGVCYVDLFAKNLAGLRKHIPYFCELGLTYLHLMPLFKSPEGNNDGGYAVSSYREVDPRLGTMAELSKVAAELRHNGISLVVDFVFNHTSDEHEWARKASEGDAKYEQFYFMFDDRSMPDAYQRTLREIFPEHRRGNFTFRDDIGKWVWTTFHSFQWDLNYANPEVFNAMLGEMLTLANNGVEVLRLDAVAFIWKQMGTSCESLPQVHAIIQAYNALTRIAAPAMIFKSEAIVHPADVGSYVKWEECPIGYNPTLMALGWEALATREVKLLLKSMQNWFRIPADCAWVNYVRSHDDIGWTFADEDAQQLWINGYDHRQFLNQFYTGKFSGSFARGLPFNYNPVNQDMRISGSAASLAGLEWALETKNERLIDHAIRRIVLLYSLALSAGGIPLIYLGDELGTLNDYSYQDDPAKAEDSRWVHRPVFDWRRAGRRTNAKTLEGRIFQTLTYLIQTRKTTPAFANGRTEFFDSGNPHVLAYTRGGEVLALVNFSEHPQTLYAGAIVHHWRLTAPVKDISRPTGGIFTPGETYTLEPLQFAWLRRG